MLNLYEGIYNMRKQCATMKYVTFCILVRHLEFLNFELGFVISNPKNMRVQDIIPSIK